MKVRRQLARLEPMVLHPLAHLPMDVWHRAPEGKWSIAQIVGHLAKGVDLSSTAFEQWAVHPVRARRATPGQAILRHLLLGLGRFPPKAEAPAVSVPADRPAPELVTAQFRMGVERFARLVDSWPSQRQLEVFVRHPVLGDLNLPEWVRFHFVHVRHHARQIRSRLKWLGR